MKFSMKGQEKDDLLIQVTAYIRGDHKGRFDCTRTSTYLYIHVPFTKRPLWS